MLSAVVHANFSAFRTQGKGDVNVKGRVGREEGKAVGYGGRKGGRGNSDPPMSNTFRRACMLCYIMHVKYFTYLPTYLPTYLLTYERPQVYFRVPYEFQINLVT